MGYKDAFRRIDSQQLRGEDATLADGGSYQIVTRDHLLEMQNLLRKSLGLSTLSKLETNAVLYDEIDGSGGPSTSSSAGYSSSLSDATDTETTYSNNTYSYSTPASTSQGNTITSPSSVDQTATATPTAVSYTHLDVYKRQNQYQRTLAFQCHCVRHQKQSNLYDQHS